MRHSACESHIKHPAERGFDLAHNAERYFCCAFEIPFQLN